MYKGEKFARKTADVVRAVAGRERYRRTSAVIVAAGDSTRMGTEKQFLDVGGMPVLARSVKAFEDFEGVGEIIIVTRKENIERVIGMCEKYGFGKVRSVVAGGATRQESVKLGFDEVSDDAEFVAIHDGARCLITPELIEKICRDAYVNKAATAATRVLDTVKQTGKNSFIDVTLERDRIWLTQTPQVFDTNLYRAALYTAAKDKFFGTDDCALVEHIGFKTIKLVECGRDNFKLTTPSDLDFARAILKIRESGL